MPKKQLKSKVEKSDAKLDKKLQKKEAKRIKREMKKQKKLEKKSIKRGKSSAKIFLKWIKSLRKFDEKSVTSFIDNMKKKKITPAQANNVIKAFRVVKKVKSKKAA